MSKKRRTAISGQPGAPHHWSRKAMRPNRIWLWIGLATLAILVVVILLWPKTPQSTEIMAAMAFQKYQQGAFFLDVRSQAEWDQAHIANSKLIPLDDLIGRLDELPPDRDIVVVCKSGVRSKEGMNILQQAGFMRSACMTGGLTAWKTAGYPLEGSAP